MLITNFIITCFCVWIATKLYNKFIRRSQINNYRFIFFSLRDRLTILVLKKQLSASDSEYTTLLKLLNSSIRIFDDNYTFAGFFRFLSRITSNATLSRDIDTMIAQLKSHNNPELVSIATDYFELNYQVFNKYTRRTPLAIFVRLLSFVAYQVREHVEMQQKIDESLKNNLQQLRVVYS